ncbi:MAG: carboxypeptidase regulatory-like domain-containing protein, partial [Planctomycetes bacterium]|nr:carboxypeptidase regulatory-like domain-containing protein [Planctomycetota bacterium]
MKRFKLFHVVAATLASVGMLASQGVALAAGPQIAANSSPRGVSQQVVDVALGSGGTLRGQLVSVSGAPRANAEVTVRFGETIVAVTKTDERGYFVVRGLRGGIYEISAQGASSLYRL